MPLYHSLDEFADVVFSVSVCSAVFVVDFDAFAGESFPWGLESEYVVFAGCCGFVFEFLLGFFVDFSVGYEVVGFAEHSAVGSVVFEDDAPVFLGEVEHFKGVFDALFCSDWASD